jgi:hypothetical protein
METPQDVIRFSARMVLGLREAVEGASGGKIDASRSLFGCRISLVVLKFMYGGEGSARARVVGRIFFSICVRQPI